MTDEDKTNPEIEKLQQEITRLRELLKGAFTLSGEQTERARFSEHGMRGFRSCVITGIIFVKCP